MQTDRAQTNTIQAGEVGTAFNAAIAQRTLLRTISLPITSIDSKSGGVSLAPVVATRSGI